MAKNNERLIELLTCSVVLAIGRGKDGLYGESCHHTTPWRTKLGSELAQDSTEHIELARMTFQLIL